MERAPGREERIARSLEWLERYRPLLDDDTAFRAALDELPPIDLLALPRRATPGRIAATLGRRGLGAETVPAAPLHVRVRGHAGAGTLPEVLLGLAFPQGVSSAVGPQALAPRRGELVLDACAAPGGKTILLDALAGGDAALIAGEPGGRTGMLVQNLSRCGVASTLVVQQDAQGFPAVGPFDVILLDAPCTGEGTFRVPAPRFDPRGEPGFMSTGALQKRLLGRALDLLAPGGRLVYSTCAYSPEENEGVLDEVLAARDDVEIAALPPGTPGVPGVTRWGERTFTAPLERTRRIFPHHLGSWGFFVALLRKDAASTRVAQPRFRENYEPAPPQDDPDARRLVLGYFGTRFGVSPETFADRLLMARGRDLWLLNGRAAAFDAGRLKVVAPGLRVLHRAGRGWQPTNAALRWLGGAVTRGVVDLTFDEAIEVLDRPVSRPGAPDELIVALRVDGVLVGKGRVAGGQVFFDLPKGWR